jgi:hypothetical protein
VNKLSGQSKEKIQPFSIDETRLYFGVSEGSGFLLYTKYEGVHTSILRAHPKIRPF